MMRMILVSFALMLFYSPALFACPSGQSCPAGKDCVADSSLCVADSASSSAPTTTKDQLGLTFDPDMFQFDSRAEDSLGVEAGTSVTYHTSPSTSVGMSLDTLFSSDLLDEDVLNADIPDPSAFEFFGGLKF